MENEIKLSSDINVITAEINSYKNVAGQAIFEIGRRLKGVRDNPSEYGFNGYKDWENWCKTTLNISRNYANKYIKVVEELGSMSNPNLGVESLYLISTIQEEDREISHNLKSGEKKIVDEMTVRELREVKKALKQAEVDKRTLAQKLTEERNKPPQVETTVVEKEIDNTDYESINKLNKQLTTLQSQLNTYENKYNLLKDKLELNEQDANEYRKMKEEVDRLHRQKDDLHRQIESATAISGLYVEIEHLLSNKLAPIKYSRALTERRDSEVAMKNLKEIINMVDEWSKEMKSYLPNENIINVEVIDYE